MDPLSQGVLGACLPQAFTNRQKIRSATAVGFFSGMLADLDVFISSSEDPLLNLEYHRQFTHSLLFIPVGGLVGALLFFLLFRLFRRLFNRTFNIQNLSFRTLYVFSTLGYATHGLLDACTTYGTQLLWPFSNHRVAWNYISIVDPLFTLPILFLVGTALKKRSPRFGQAALLWSLMYLSLGYIQRERALDVAKETALARGHSPTRIDAKPSFGNIVLWKLVYAEEGRLYVDAVRLGRTTEFFVGESVARFELGRDFPQLDPKSQQALDIERFRWFSNDFLAMHPKHSNVIGDARYSMLPNEIKPLWGIEIDINSPNKHVQLKNFRDLSDRQKFWRMLGL